MYRAIAVAVGILCIACGTAAGSGSSMQDDDERLRLIGDDVGGIEIWYDSERREECSPYSTEYNSVRCFPRFTRIEGADLRYLDADCRSLIAWSDLERKSDRYVAYMSDEYLDPPLVYSIFGVIERIIPNQDETVETYIPNESKCVAMPKVKAAPYVAITTRLHPEEFAPVP